MARTKVFVSYSHKDEAWLKRFQQHVAILVRQKAIEIWSDNRIDAGVDWERAINDALTSSNVAVLLVSPAFLASQYIWNNEMPLILKHCEAGMDVLPLIVRPCAWRLDPDLAKLQARPTDDRALSTGSESDIDLNLAAFTYELAMKVKMSKRAAEGDTSLMPHPDHPHDPRGAWAGYYNHVRPLCLVVEHIRNRHFEGRLEYPNEGTVTTVVGSVHQQLPPNDPVWSHIGGSDRDTFRFGVIFRETRYEVRGGAAISFDGVYRGIVIGREMIGGWYSDRQMVGQLTLRRV